MCFLLAFRMRTAFAIEGDCMAARGRCRPEWLRWTALARLGMNAATGLGLESALPSPLPAAAAAAEDEEEDGADGAALNSGTGGRGRCCCSCCCLTSSDTMTGTTSAVPATRRNATPVMSTTPASAGNLGCLSAPSTKSCAGEGAAGEGDVAANGEGGTCAGVVEARAGASPTPSDMSAGAAPAAAAAVAEEDAAACAAEPAAAAAAPARGSSSDAGAVTGAAPD